MPKDDRQRIEQTIVFLERLPGSFHQYATAAGNYLRRYTNGNQLKPVSELMSLGPVAPHERARLEAARHTRRALILVNAVLLDDTAQRARQKADTLADAQLEQALKQALDKWVQGQKTALNPSYDKFVNSTANFLQTDHIFVDSKGGEGEVDYFWGWDELNRRYLMSGDGKMRTPVVTKKPVFHVPCTPYAELKGKLDRMPCLKVTRSPCITTQLTGCSYVFHIDGNGDLFVCHAWPKGDIAAKQLCTDLRASGMLRLPNGNSVKPQVFGVTDSNNGMDYTNVGTKTYVVAEGGKGNWRIHIQQKKHDGNLEYWRIL